MGEFDNIKDDVELLGSLLVINLTTDSSDVWVLLFEHVVIFLLDPCEEHKWFLYLQPLNRSKPERNVIFIVKDFVYCLNLEAQFTFVRIFRLAERCDYLEVYNLVLNVFVVII